MTTVHPDVRPADSAAPAAPERPSAPDPAASTHLSLGYLGFSATLFLLALFHTALVSFDFIVAVFPTAIFFGGLAQLIAGTWAYLQRDFFAAVFFTSFAAFWLSYTLYLWMLLPPLVEEHGNAVTEATGSYTLTWGLVALFFAVAARHRDRATFVLMCLVTCMYAGITTGQYAVAPLIDLVGGIFALLSALLGLYVGAAYLVNGSHGRTVLPLGAPRS